MTILKECSLRLRVHRTLKANQLEYELDLVAHQVSTSFEKILRKIFLDSNFSEQFFVADLRQHFQISKETK